MGRAPVLHLTLTENMNQTILIKEEKIRLVANMERYGGNFVSRLAQAMIAADPENFQRLCIAFPEIVEKYLNWEKF